MESRATGKNLQTIRYYDYYSIVLHSILSLIALAIFGFLFWAGAFWIAFAIILLVKFISIINFVIFIDGDFVILKYYKIIRVKIPDVVNLTCERAGLGSSRSNVIWLYYQGKNGKIEKSQLMHNDLFNSSKLLGLLDQLEGRIATDDRSFSIMGIVKRDGKFIKS